MIKIVTLVLHSSDERPLNSGYYLVWLKHGVVIECYCRYHKFTALAFYPEYLKHEVQLKNYTYWAEMPNVKKIPVEAINDGIRR